MTTQKKETAAQARKRLEAEQKAREQVTVTQPTGTTTTTTTPAKEVEVVAEVIPPPPIQPAFFSGIFPVFIAETTGDIDRIKESDYNNAFILGRIEEKDPSKPHTSVYRDALFQMANNPTSYGLSEIPFSALDAKAILKPTAYLKTPRMPWHFVAKMDMFFRAAHAKYGTESIVMLTYDNDAFGTDNEGAGWDFYVPTQKNTAMDCDYQKDEVLAHIEGTNKTLIGSAHSHPEMSAFFSSTDHKDQADWPGLHITFAWSKGSRVSTHHIELIQNGKTWKYDDPSFVFEEPPLPNIDVDFEAVLTAKVAEKVHTPTVTTTGYKPGTGGGTPANAYKGNAVDNRQLLRGTNRKAINTGPQTKQAPIFLPENAPSVKDNIIVARIPHVAKSCAFCSAPITEKMKEYSSCYACGGLFLFEGESLQTLVDQRKRYNCDVTLLEGDDLKTPVYIWDSVTTEEEIVHEFALVGGGDDKTPKA